MIVLAIIGILASIAIPNYSEYVTKSKLADAIAPLSDMRVKMERHFQDNRTYVGACVAGTQAPLPANTTNFTFSCPGADLTGTTYKVVATGVGSMAGFILSIDEANIRRTEGVGAGWTAPATNCWVRSKGGAC
ncbi:MAG: hypothetical protein K9K30_05435 [Burkholderiaceae bacterium]|nr:hypothetical protein [Burkholderiaceae bacterium]